MPLGIVSDKDFMSERNNSDVDIKESTKEIMDPVTITGTVEDMPNVGRPVDIPDVPLSLKKVLGETHQMEGLASAQELMRTLGGKISQPTLSTYGRGEVSPGSTTLATKELSGYIAGRKTKVSKRALNKLNMALSHLTDDKLSECGAGELAGVAKSMSTVVQMMEPRQIEEKKEPIQFHIYAPSVRNETHYDTVVAKDNY